MYFLYCGNPLNYKNVDPDYEDEYLAAMESGIKTGFINFEELVYFDNPANAIRNIEKSIDMEYATFRGWMMTPEQYESFYYELLKKNIKLINTPSEYKHCHYLPEAYDIIKDFTPKTLWIKKSEFLEDMSNIWKLFKQFDKAVMIKDFVKSRKHEWEDACYIPDTSDIQNVQRVVNNFISRQGLNLSEGLVIREFVELEYLTNHHKSNMPLTKEFRIFFFKGEPIVIMNYWDEGVYGDLTPELAQFLSAAKNIKSNFFTMDIAKKKNGEWIIVEVGDGQVSGINDNKYIKQFYKGIADIL